MVGQAVTGTLFNGQPAFVSDTTQNPFVAGVVPVVGDSPNTSVLEERLQRMKEGGAAASGTRSGFTPGDRPAAAPPIAAQRAKAATSERERQAAPSGEATGGNDSAGDSLGRSRTGRQRRRNAGGARARFAVRSNARPSRSRPAPKQPRWPAKRARRESSISRRRRAASPLKEQLLARAARLAPPAKQASAAARR